MKWLIVAILFIGDVPLKGRMLTSPDIDADCQKELATLQQQAKEAELDIWAKCVQVDHEVKAIVVPKPDPGDGDGILPDGRRRGSKS